MHTHLNRQKHRYTYTPSTWTHPHRPSTHTDTPLNIYILIGFPGLAKSVRRGWKDPPRQVLWLFAAQVPTYLLRAGLLQQPLGLVPPCSPSTSPLPPCPSFASSMELDLPWMATGQIRTPSENPFRTVSVSMAHKKEVISNQFFTDS